MYHFAKRLAVHFLWITREALTSDGSLQQIGLRWINTLESVAIMSLVLAPDDFSENQRA